MIEHFIPPDDGPLLPLLRSEAGTCFRADAYMPARPRACSPPVDIMSLYDASLDDPYARKR